MENFRQFFRRIFKHFFGRKHYEISKNFEKYNNLKNSKTDLSSLEFFDIFWMMVLNSAKWNRKSLIFTKVNNSVCIKFATSPSFSSSISLLNQTLKFKFSLLIAEEKEQLPVVSESFTWKASRLQNRQLSVWDDKMRTETWFIFLLIHCHIAWFYVRFLLSKSL